MKNAFLHHALELAAWGMSIHPLRPREKLPLLKGWQEKASAEPDRIETYWAEYPNANIGVCTGAVSNIFVLDVDGDEGLQSLSALEKRHGTLPLTLEADTGSGGKHYYFKWPREMDIRNSVKQLGAGLDIRGNGGYVVAPPSLHPNGNQYEWSALSGDQPVDAPKWLLELINNKAGKDQAIGNPSHGVTDWGALSQEIPEGARNNTLVRVAGKLISLNLDPYLVQTLVLGLNQYRCCPPLEEVEVIKIVENICKKEFEKRSVAK